MKKNRYLFFYVITIIFFILLTCLLIKQKEKTYNLIIETPISTMSDCVRAGCSNQLCVEASLAEDIITTCEYKAEYACYQQAVCKRLETGECGFVEDEALLECLDQSEELFFSEDVL